MEVPDGPVDPGWKPAMSTAVRLATGRPLRGPILLVMRGLVLLMAGVAGLTGAIAVILGAGSGEASIDAVTAHVLLGLAVVAAAIAMGVVGRSFPEVGAGPMASHLFTVVQRRVVAAAAVGPAGFLLSWLAADGAQVIFGVGASLLLITIAAPTAERIRMWQEEINGFDDPYDVLEALLVPYR